MAELKDAYGRKISYLRISVTDRCNLRCYYCLPKEEFVLKKRREILSLEELERIAKLAAILGITKIRFTGGEPLLRRGVDHLVRQVSSIPGIADLSLTTNGTLLRQYARKLKDSGLKRINISLDTLNPLKFQNITGANLWHKVKEGIMEALSLFDKVKMNVVMVKGTNEDEILDFIEFVKDKPIGLRFIEFMPIGNNGWSLNKFIPSSFIKDQIQRKYEVKKIHQDSGDATAEIYGINGFKDNLGFISPLSKGFCPRCNKLRLTADGFLKPCLSSDLEIDVKSKIRTGATDEELVEAFKKALALKPKEHGFLQKGGHKRRMFQIGG